jgi:hypothetical protein
MNKIATLTFFISLLITPSNALEKKDCSGLKKISKAYVACKSGNLKAGIVNTGSKIKKNTLGKVKKTKTTENETTTNEKKNTTVSKISNATKEKTAGIKAKFNKIFSGGTKQYPKGTQ